VVVGRCLVCRFEWIASLSRQQSAGTILRKITKAEYLDPKDWVGCLQVRETVRVETITSNFTRANDCRTMRYDNVSKPPTKKKM
jgi:hypothetical protein